jgi:hypothetical protein
MTRTSTLLCGCQLISVQAAGRRRGGGEAVNVHFFLVGSHRALQNFLEAGDSFQCLASVIQHSPSGRAEVKAIEQSAGGAVARGDWGVV